MFITEIKISHFTIGAAEEKIGQCCLYSNWCSAKYQNLIQVFN